MKVNAILNRIRDYKSNYFDWVKDFAHNKQPLLAVTEIY